MHQQPTTVTRTHVNNHSTPAPPVTIKLHISWTCRCEPCSGYASTILSSITCPLTSITASDPFASFSAKGNPLPSYSKASTDICSSLPSLVSNAPLPKLLHETLPYDLSSYLGHMLVSINTWPSTTPAAGPALESSTGFREELPPLYGLFSTFIRIIRCIVNTRS